MDRLTKEEFVERAKKIHEGKYDYKLVEYAGSKIKVKIICPEHGEFFQAPGHHLQRVGCPHCTGNAKGTTKKFIEKAKRIHGDTYDYKLVDYKNNYTKVKIICSIHGIFEQLPHNHFHGKGCSKCTGNLKSTSEEFIEKARKIHGDIYNYSNTIYVNAITKVKIICLEHGIFEQTPNTHLCGAGCPSCNNSRGESEIRENLKRLNVKFKEQKTFDDCKNIYLLPFDFYLEDFNMCIEFDGIQHFKPIKFFGGQKGFESRLKNDKTKNEFCLKNKIHLERIKYNENIDLKIKNLFP